MRELVLEEQGFGIPLAETLVVFMLAPQIQILAFQALNWDFWRVIFSSFCPRVR